MLHTWLLLILLTTAFRQVKCNFILETLCTCESKHLIIKDECVTASCCLTVGQKCFAMCAVKNLLSRSRLGWHLEDVLAASLIISSHWIRCVIVLVVGLFSCGLWSADFNAYNSITVPPRSKVTIEHNTNRTSYIANRLLPLACCSSNCKCPELALHFGSRHFGDYLHFGVLVMLLAMIYVILGLMQVILRCCWR